MPPRHRFKTHSQCQRTAANPPKSAALTAETVVFISGKIIGVFYRQAVKNGGA
jgi:hypothetical protein